MVVLGVGFGCSFWGLGLGCGLVWVQSSRWMCWVVLGMGLVCSGCFAYGAGFVFDWWVVLSFGGGLRVWCFCILRLSGGLGLFCLVVGVGVFWLGVWNLLLWIWFWVLFLFLFWVLGGWFGFGVGVVLVLVVTLWVWVVFSLLWFGCYFVGWVLSIVWVC